MPVNLKTIKRFFFAPGGIRLMAMRWGLLVLASLPGLRAARERLAPFSRKPWFAEAGSPLPAVQSMELMNAATKMEMKAYVIVCVLIALIGHQMLTSGAIQILCPESAGRKRVVKTVIRSGMETLWPYICIVFWSAVWIWVGAALIKSVFEYISEDGQKAGWTMQTMSITIPLLKMGAVLLWAHLVGAFAHWCRVLTRADNRKRLRRTVLLVFKAWREIPFQGPVFYVAVSVFSFGVGALTLFAWRQSPSPEIWFAVWHAALFFQCFLWFCLVRAACVSVEKETVRQIRREPDDPWYVNERIRTMIMKYRFGDRLYKRVPVRHFF